MKVKVLGFSEVFHYSKGDYDACNVYIARDPFPRENVTGFVTQNVFLRKDELKLIPSGGFKAGASYDFNYEPMGRYSVLTAINPL